MATARPRPNISKNDALVVHIVKQLCTSVTGLSDGRCELRGKMRHCECVDIMGHLARIDQYWQHQDIIFDFRAQIEGTRSRSEVSRVNI